MIPASVFEPGKAYFVRVLAPEGITLVFDPQSGQSRGASNAMSATPVVNGWRMGVTLIDDDFRVGAQIGESSTATLGFDPKEDSPLPPAPAGGRRIQRKSSTSM